MKRINCVYLACASYFALSAVKGYCWGSTSYLGDGYCDSTNNNADCNWDDGDCCQQSCVDGTYSCSNNNFDCLDPTYSSATTTTSSSSSCNSLTYYSYYGSCSEQCQSTYGSCASVSFSSSTYNGYQTQSCKCCDCGYTTTNSPNSTSSDDVIIVVLVVVCVFILVVVIASYEIFLYKKKAKSETNEKPKRRQTTGSCLCFKKLFHFTYSFKPMILLFYALYSDVSGLLNDMTISGAADVTYDHGSDGCDAGDMTVLQLCPGSFTSHPLYIAAILLVGCASLYGFIIFAYSLLKSPPYHTLAYYAFLVMTKRQRYFRIFLKTMYLVIALLMLMYIMGMVVLAQRMGTFSPDFLGSVFSTLLISGIAVSELRTTNEIHFEYEVLDAKEKDNAFAKPIYLLPLTNCCGCSLETAEDLFERLEEAVSLYAVTKQAYLLKEILLYPTEEEIERVMLYYAYIYNKDVVPLQGFSGAMNKVQSISTQSMDNKGTDPDTTIIYKKEHAPSAPDAGIDLVLETTQVDENKETKETVMVKDDDEGMEQIEHRDETVDLPAGWRVMYREDGQRYYQNDITKNTSAEIPKPMDQEKRKELPLPDGWRKEYTDENKAYYVSDVTNVTQWEHPMMYVVK